MNQTEKLYDLDAYAIEFDATVQSCEEISSETGICYQITLDRTLFFPEEGGQSPDSGNINEISVIDVQIKEDIIVHTLVKPLKVGEQVHGCIDWKHRFNNMQQHTGEHIFSGLVNKRFGYDNVGFHLSDQIVTMDFSGVLTAQEAADIEFAVNEVIIKNIPVQVTFPSKEELVNLNYRSKIEIDGQVRIVTIDGVDVCACCAPHVRSTGEIGMLKIMNMQNYKGGVRVSILCGFRALEEYRQKTAILSELTSSLSANQDSLVEAVNKLKNTNQSLKTEVAVAKQECMELKLEKIPKEQEDVYVFEGELDAQVMRNAVNQLVSEHSGICGIFSGDDEEGYRFIIGSSTKDAREVATVLREKLGAKGGGSAAMVQGSVTAKRKEILEIISSI
ncbi:alanyl-tRNA editing protein [Anaerosporobacter sp.]|uniref:alanyl-tRNA editing protein n=1 Tax=Anaerosporobacter sp. TaxID=1872529 RepID=UPI00286F6D30|nr:DHHA1 domain-containing protein [Anaerosporobacter sp.]